MVSMLRRLFGGDATAIDPVCGMTVDMKNPPGGSYGYDGKTHYFCGRGCRLEFQEDPTGYLSGEKKMGM